MLAACVPDALPSSWLDSAFQSDSGGACQELVKPKALVAATAAATAGEIAATPVEPAGYAAVTLAKPAPALVAAPTLIMAMALSYGAELVGGASPVLNVV